MLAIIENGGKQYHIALNSIVKVEKIRGEPGQVIQLDKVMVAGTKIGQPYLEEAKVIAEVIACNKTNKIVIFKKKRRHNYRRKRGHRQQITLLRIKEIIV